MNSHSTSQTLLTPTYALPISSGLPLLVRTTMITFCMNALLGNPIEIIVTPNFSSFVCDRPAGNESYKRTKKANLDRTRLPRLTGTNSGQGQSRVS